MCVCVFFTLLWMFKELEHCLVTQNGMYVLEDTIPIGPIVC